MAAPTDPYYPYRIYADPFPGGQGLTYTDHSRFLRNHIRGLFLKGQQLWDNDWNNNQEIFALWKQMWAIYRKNQKDGQMPPYYSPYLNRRVLDPKNAPVDGYHDHFIYHWQKGMQYVLYYKPEKGNFCWVDADRTLCVFTNNGWTGLSRLADEEWNVEVAIFINGAKKGKNIATKCVSQPFRLARQRNVSRGEGVIFARPFEILKNGVVVGMISQGKYNCVTTINTDTDFHTGDLLQVRANATQANAVCTISLVGMMI
jgi:hypothetical protein